jgi:glycosyltransferase involved in cell wall biosynthesis
MEHKVSVCIPTCDRPAYLEEALRSVLSQTPEPFEVVIGDDSTQEKTAKLVQSYEGKGAPIRYIRNRPSLGQAKNVDRLFQEARGEFIVLLHDDDQLLGGALDVLGTCLEEDSGLVAAFGKQQIVDAEGAVIQRATRGVNQGYYRTAEYEGKQPDSLRSAIIQQFPNDGYMVRARAAREVGYDRPEAGDACDFAFGVELARQSSGDFYYVDAFVSQYRHSEESVVRGEESADTAYRAFKVVTERLPDRVRSDPYVQKWLRERSPVAIMMAAQNGFTTDGLRWFFGPYHRRRIFSLGGGRRLLALLRSLF